MAKKTKYPPNVYYEHEGESGGMFNTCIDPNRMVLHSETMEVGEYAFKRMVRLVNKTTVEPVKAAKKRKVTR